MLPKKYDWLNDLQKRCTSASMTEEERHKGEWVMLEEIKEHLRVGKTRAREIIQAECEAGRMEKMDTFIDMPEGRRIRRTLYRATDRKSG